MPPGHQVRLFPGFTLLHPTAMGRAAVCPGALVKPAPLRRYRLDAVEPTVIAPVEHTVSPTLDTEFRANKRVGCSFRDNVLITARDSDALPRGAVRQVLCSRRVRVTSRTTTLFECAGDRYYPVAVLLKP